MLVPVEYYPLAVLLLAASELAYRYSPPARLINSWFVCGMWPVVYMLAVMLAWCFLNPFVVHPQGHRLAVVTSLPPLTIFQMFVFASHLSLSPQTLLYSYLHAYFRNIALYLQVICRREADPELCRICNEQAWTFCALQEKYLLERGVRLQNRFIVGGVCGHVFHRECMRRRVFEEGERTCPVDGARVGREWLEEVYGEAPVV